MKIIEGSLSLSEITGKHLNDFVGRRKREKRKPQAIKQGIKFICGVMKQAKREGYAVANIETPSIPVKLTRLRCLSTEEEQSLLKKLDPNRLSNAAPAPVSLNS